MIEIRKAILDGRGETVASGRLPLRFGSRAAAIAFLEWYLTAVFAEGRSGYQSEGGYWWGCDASDETCLHRYGIADELARPLQHPPEKVVLDLIGNEHTGCPQKKRPSLNS
jgi:hypothetical protein